METLKQDYTGEIQQAFEENRGEIEKTQTKLAKNAEMELKKLSKLSENSKIRYLVNLEDSYEGVIEPERWSVLPVSEFVKVIEDRIKTLAPEEYTKWVNKIMNDSTETSPDSFASDIKGAMKGHLSYTDYISQTCIPYAWSLVPEWGVEK